jgi:transposase
VRCQPRRRLRHRLNRGGDRQANSAPWRIVFTSMATDPRTRALRSPAPAEGKTAREIIRCLKRYVVREVYKALTRRHPAAEPGPSRVR